MMTVGAVAFGGSGIYLFNHLDSIPYIQIPFEKLLVKEDQLLLNTELKEIQLSGIENVNTYALVKNGEEIGADLVSYFFDKERLDDFRNGKSVNGSFHMLNVDDKQKKKIFLAMDEFLQTLKNGELKELRLIDVSETENQKHFQFLTTAFSDEEAYSVLPLGITTDKEFRVSNVSVGEMKQSEYVQRALSTEESDVSEEDDENMLREVRSLLVGLSNQNVYNRYKDENAKSNLNRHLSQFDFDDTTLNVLKDLFLFTKGNTAQFAISEIYLTDDQADAITEITVKFTNGETTKEGLIRYNRTISEIISIE